MRGWSRVPPKPKGFRPDRTNSRRRCAHRFGEQDRKIAARLPALIEGFNGRLSAFRLTALTGNLREHTPLLISFSSDSVSVGRAMTNASTHPATRRSDQSWRFPRRLMPEFEPVSLRRHRPVLPPSRGLVCAIAHDDGRCAPSSSGRCHHACSGPDFGVLPRSRTFNDHLCRLLGDHGDRRMGITRGYGRHDRCIGD